MGAAKRRHDQIGRELGDVTLDNGTVTSNRYGGRFGEYLEEYRRSASTSPVPCNGCTACCYYPKIDFEPGLERPEDLEHLDMVPDPERVGWAVLRKREDGGCIHLGPDDQCQVYEHRPLPCRKYDCRIFSAVGVIDHFEGGRLPPVWSFDITELRDQVRELALRIAAAKYVAGKKEWTAGEVVKEAFIGFQEALPEAERLVFSKDKRQ